MTPFEKLSRSLTGASPLPEKTARKITLAAPLLISAGGRVQTVLGWSRELNIPLATLRYRHLAGWPPAQILGFERRDRDRTAEQSTLISLASVVVINYDNQPMTRKAAAAALGIQPKSLAQRLRKWRVAGRQSCVGLADLYAGSRLEARRTPGLTGVSPHSPNLTKLNK